MLMGCPRCDRAARSQTVRSFRPTSQAAPFCIALVAEDAELASDHLLSLGTPELVDERVGLTLELLCEHCFQTTEGEDRDYSDPFVTPGLERCFE